MQEVTVETDADGVHVVTDRVADAVPDGHDGAVAVFCRHTSASVVINEHDGALEQDVRDHLYELVPHDDEHDYRHGQGEHQPNAHAHLKTLLTGNSLTIPVADGALALGTYQAIMLLDFDGPRTRTLLVQPLAAGNP